MNKEKFLNKKAQTLSGEHLGEIVRIEGSKDGAVEAKKPQAIIRVKRFLYRDDFVRLPIEIDYDQVDTVSDVIVFDISKDDFKKLQKAYRYERKTKDSKKPVGGMRY